MTGVQPHAFARTGGGVAPAPRGTARPEAAHEEGGRL